MRRLWCVAAGLPVGLLAALALAGPQGPKPVWLGLGAAAGALLLPALVWVAGRARGEPDRTLVPAAQAGWLALPAAAFAWLGLAPGATVLGVGVLAVLASSLGLGGRGAQRSPMVAAAVFALGGGAVWLVLAGFLAARGAAEPSFNEGTAAAIYEVDARVPTRPLPVCGDAPARVETLRERGANPRFSREGAELWFDAPADDGLRQIHRLALADGAVACLTCGEGGNNRRPAPSRTGRAVVFDSDRNADRATPANTEIYHLRIVAGAAPRPSRRLTHAPGRDDHPVLDPAGRGVVWSRGAGGRFSVVSAGFRSGHGALLLADPRVILPGGAGWTAPVAWSADARGLAWVRGNPFGALTGSRLDPATARVDALGDGIGARGVAYSGDGGRVAVASSGAGAGLGRLPAFLGFGLGALPSAIGAQGGDGPTRLRIGLAKIAPLRDVDLGPAAEWGAPAGVALSPDGTWIALGQRKASGQERLLGVTLDCALP